ncbi:molybdate transporter 1 [Artemisia annua]|uniref:Molybdate transporter 1 n=1 Tax=Artemisia annua TaxID=35608 RepID=A0A2U1KFH0_ARTAN|nr:molybdate transporter 1 [Artemisia annua]
MGDLGTYIPIVLALTLASHLNLGTTLIFTGVYNIVTGAIYGVPMPVQPMKSIAAVAISDPDFGIPEVMAAGICTGVILFALGVTGLMRLAYRLIPLPVVRGIQLAQGLNFAMTAVKYVRKVQDFSKSKSKGNRDWLGLDGLVLAIVCICFITIVNGAGVILAIIREPKVIKGFNFGPSSIQVIKISKTAWKKGFIKGTIPQLPLSILNSVIAVCKLSTDLFPEKTVTPTSVSVTVGLMNVVGCWFGAMPCCHGAGGLAGQYKFGGRSGACVALLGGTKLLLGLLLGSSIVKILTAFPVGVLGVLLLFAGIELAMCARDMKSKEESFVVLICTAVSLVGSSAALGFVTGMVVHLLLRLRKLGGPNQIQSFSAFWMHNPLPYNKNEDDTKSVYLSMKKEVMVDAGVQWTKHGAEIAEAHSLSRFAHMHIDAAKNRGERLLDGVQSWVETAGTHISIAEHVLQEDIRNTAVSMAIDSKFKGFYKDYGKQFQISYKTYAPTILENA